MSNKPEFPIAIALTGAPGSGKNQVAWKFGELFTPYLEKYEHELKVIPNTGKIIEQSYDRAMGLFGDYNTTLWANYLRYEMEQDARKAGKSFITVGCVLDNMAHGGVKIEDIRTGLQTPDTEPRMMKEMHATTVMSFLFMDTFRYTFGFYLPAKEAIVLPGQEEDATSPFNQRIDMALRTIYQNFGLRIQVLDQPSIDEQAQEMVDTVVRIMENGPDPEPEIEADAAGESEVEAAVETDNTEEETSESADTLAE